MIRFKNSCIWLACVMVATTARGQPNNAPRDDFWVSDGQINAITETNGIIYVGGLFDYISPVSETGNAFDLISGGDLPDFPRFNGIIKAIISDNAGGWFVGGFFTAAGGIPVTNLAHIRADKTVDPAFAPNPDGMVLALAASETRVYAGGLFAAIGGQARSLLAAIDGTTGAALPWQADCTTSFSKPSVNALVLSGNTLFVGGYFSFINGQEREHLGSVDATTGQVTSWIPNGYVGGEVGARVDALALAGNVIYAGGTFSSIGGALTNGPTRNYVAALDTTKNFGDGVLPWNPNANGPVTSLAVSCDTVYIGGSFTSIGGQTRNRIAAVDGISGIPTAWNPDANNTVQTLVLAGNALYVGGKFTQIGGQARNSLAALDVNSGQGTLWNPRADFGVGSLCVAGSSVVAGGTLGPGGKLRQNVAAFNARTGKPLDWSPTVSGSTLINAFPSEGVYAIAASADTVFLGGPFAAVNGLTRNHIAAVDAVTGAVKSWDAKANGLVTALTVFGSNVYAGGRFTTIGGTSRTNIAGLDAVTGGATAWNPNANDKVTALARIGNVVYAGGTFTQIGGQTRKRLAAINPLTGAATSWDPNVDDLVAGLAFSGPSLYFGGQFSIVGGQARSRLAAVDLSSGLVSCWNPNVSAGAHWPGVNAIVASGNQIYAGGSFSSVAGQPRGNLAGVATNCSATPSSWTPNTDASVTALATAGNSIIAAGLFQNVGGQYRPNLAVFAPIGSPVIVRQPRTLIVTNGQPVLFEAEATGQGPLAFQWQANGTNIAGATSSTFSIASVSASNSADYSLTVTNALGLINSRPARLIVVEPLRILTQPASTTVAPGTTVTFSVAVRGNPSPTFQWRLNGVNIPGAVYSSLTITNAQPTNGGSYNVVVANVGGTISSGIGTLIVSSPSLSFADNFSGRGSISGSSGLGSGSNASATREPGEPNHAGKIGSRSVWVSWIAPANGIATFSTRGSTFDTLLGIYTGSTLSNLVQAAADDDRDGFATSQASYNALAGTEYIIAVDGFAGSAGQIVLSWNLDTSTTPFPRIISQPLSQTVLAGNSVSFSVTVNSSSSVSYQWFHACHPIAGATNATLLLGKVGAADVGNYHVVVMNASTHAAESENAFLELGPQAKVISQDKLEDLFLEQNSTSSISRASPIIANTPGGFLLVSLGTISSQVLNNSTATTSQNETNHCGVLGGSSQWIGVHPTASGVMQVDTIGSAIDTVLAVYTGTSLLNIQQVACDNNGAPDGIRSLLKFNAVAGTDYLLTVDGVNGAKGNISLNWKLGLLPIVTSSNTTSPVAQGGSVTFLAQVSSPTPDLTYQWRLNGQAIVGATNVVLTLTNIQLSQAGSYSLIARNFAGSVTNTVGKVNIALPITLTSQVFRTNGTRVFRLNGPSSRGYVILASTNVSCTNCWVPVFTNNAAAAPLDFSDLRWTNFSRRFYKVTPWP